MYRSSVKSLTQDEIQSPSEQKEREEFYIAIREKFGPAMNKDDFQDDPDYADFVTPTYECYEDDEVPPSKMPEIDAINFLSCSTSVCCHGRFNHFSCAFC
jgi:hypothetical protein